MSGVEGTINLVVLLLAVVAAVSVLTSRAGLADTLPLLACGVLLSLVPGLSGVEISPTLAFALFFPVLLYAAAVFGSVNELRANLYWILAMAFGLVVITMLVVATVAHTIIEGISWPLALLIGAVLSPADSASPIARVTDRLPQRVAAVLRGEQLLHAIALLVAFLAAVEAVEAGESLSLTEASLQFVTTNVGGIAVGLTAGWLFLRLRSMIRSEDAGNHPVELTLSLLTPFAAFVPAEFVGASGYAAVIAAGLLLSWRGPVAVPSSARLRGLAIWRVVLFVLVGLFVVLTGLQFRGAVENIPSGGLGEVLVDLLLLILTVVVTRTVWVFGAAWLQRIVDRRSRHDREHGFFPSWKQAAVIAWSGPRQITSPAAALALPITTTTGEPFPGRDLVILLAFSAFAITQILQGSTTPALVRRLKLERDGDPSRKEQLARLAAAKAALSHLRQKENTAAGEEAAIRALSARYQAKVERFDPSSAGSSDDGDDAYSRLRTELLEKERATVVGLRDRGEIEDAVLHRLEHEFDAVEEQESR